MYFDKTCIYAFVLTQTHQKVLRHSGLTIHILNNLAMSWGIKPLTSKWWGQLSDIYAPSSSHLH